MEYRYSQHYREEPLEEIDAALTANSPESVRETLEARLSTEKKLFRPDKEAKKRIKQQLAYVTMIASDVEVAA